MVVQQVASRWHFFFFFFGRSYPKLWPKNGNKRDFRLKIKIFWGGGMRFLETADTFVHRYEILDL